MVKQAIVDLHTGRREGDPLGLRLETPKVVRDHLRDVAEYMPVSYVKYGKDTKGVIIDGFYFELCSEKSTDALKRQLYKQYMYNQSVLDTEFSIKTGVIHLRDKITNNYLGFVVTGKVKTRIYACLYNLKKEEVCEA